MVTEINYTEEKWPSGYSILILFQDENYFYAEEKIIQENQTIEKTYK